MQLSGTLNVVCIENLGFFYVYIYVGMHPHFSALNSGVLGFVPLRLGALSLPSISRT